MTIKATSTAKHYRPDLVRKRYVRLAYDDKFRWCEVGEDARYDLRQGMCAESDLPPTTAAAARAKRDAGVWPFNVDWPL